MNQHVALLQFLMISCVLSINKQHNGVPTALTLMRRATLVLEGNTGEQRKTQTIIVLRFLERNGKVQRQIIPDASQDEILPVICSTVKFEADISTDG